MHLLDPVAQAVEDHAPDDRIVCVKCVSRAAVVGIWREQIFFQDVINVVVQSTETQRWAGNDRLRRYGCRQRVEDDSRCQREEALSPYRETH